MRIVKKQYKKTMALLEEIEPPSPLDAEMEKTKKLEKISKIKNQLHNGLSKFLGKQYEKMSFCKTSTVSICKRIKQYFVTSKYLPHVAMLSLLFLVILSNHNSKLIAQASSADFVNTTPDAEYNLSTSADRYTPLIPDDGGSVEKAVMATYSNDGFMENSSTVLTQLTNREELIKENLPDNTSKTITYTILNGDTLTGIGWKFDVKIASIKYVNDMDNIDTIRPGSKIKIPPKNYEVSQSAIAKKESERRAKLAASSRNTVTRSTSSTRSTVNYAPGSKYNGYPYGYCTYFVATKRAVPNSWGDAKRWLSSAKNAGYATGSTPAVGAIVVTAESWWGHVAFVESVNGGSITISEMNARGWGVTSTRTISAYGGVVRGYIY